MSTKKLNHLDNWLDLCDGIKSLDEKAIKDLIDKEKNGEARPQFLIRLYGRYNKLRATRERKELLTFRK